MGSRRGKRSASSGRTVVYPFCSTKQQAIQCVMFLHDNASRILASVIGPLAPVVSVSCADTLRDILAGNGTGVFEPDAKCRHLPNAKAHLPRFCINLSSEHSFTTSSGVHLCGTSWVLPSPVPLARLRRPPDIAVRATDMTSRKSISHPAASATYA